MQFSVQVLGFFKSSLKIHHIASFWIPRGHQKTLGLWQRPLPSELMVKLTEEAGCLSHKGPARHRLPEGVSNTSFKEGKKKRKSSKIEELLNQNARLLVGCRHLTSEPSSAPLVAPPPSSVFLIHSPATTASPNLHFLLAQTCVAPLAQPLPHLPSWAPQLNPSHAASYQPFIILHAAFYPRTSCTKSSPFLPFEHPRSTNFPSSPAALHRGGGWVKRKKGWWRSETGSPLAVLVPKPCWCYHVGDPLQKCFSRSL